MHKLLRLSIAALLFVVTTCVVPTRAPMMKFQTATAVHSCKPDKNFPQMIRLPFFGKATQVVNDCAIYPNYQVAVALLVFYYTWIDYFGDEGYAVSNLLDDIMIEWGPEKKTITKAYNVHGESVLNRKILGMVMSDTMIWVYQRGRFDTDKISDTSLIHELVHVAIRAVGGGSGDPDHEGDKYDGWTPAHTALIREANGVLRSYGI